MDDTLEQKYQGALEGAIADGREPISQVDGQTLLWRQGGEGSVSLLIIRRHLYTVTHQHIIVPDQFREALGHRLLEGQQS